jgi:large repetitive protein
MRLLTLTIVCVMLCIATRAQTTVNIGSGTTNINSKPLYTCYSYNYSQQIYLANEISSGAGLITKVRFYYATGGTSYSYWSDWTLYLGNTTKSSFNSNTDWESYSNLTQVYNANIATPATGTWIELELSTPFVYSGGNLVVALDENSPNYSCTATWGAYNTGSDRSMLYYSDGTNPNPQSPPTSNVGASVYNNRLQFDIVPVAACAGTPVAGTITGPSSVDANMSFTLSVLNYSLGAGISNQWQSSVDGSTWLTSPGTILLSGRSARQAPRIIVG